MPCVLSFVAQSSNKITPAATPCSTFRVWRWPVDGQTFVTHHHQCNHQHHQCNHHHWWFTNATTTNVIHHHHCNHQIVKIQWPGHQWCLSTFPLWTVILNGVLNLSSQLCLVMTTDNIFRTFHRPQFVSGPASTGGATWLLWQFWLETFARTSRPAQTLIWRTNTKIQIHKCKKTKILIHKYKFWSETVARKNGSAQTPIWLVRWLNMRGTVEPMLKESTQFGNLWWSDKFCIAVRSMFDSDVQFKFRRKCKEIGSQPNKCSYNDCFPCNWCNYT